MYRIVLLTISICAFMMCQTSKTDVKSASATGSMANAEKTFTTFCASCHGENSDVFAERTWKHGKSRPEIIKSITTGYPDLSMPAWGLSLKPQQIEDLADYFLAAFDRRKNYEFTDKPKSNIFEHTSISVKLDTVVKGLKNPWGMAFLPNGDMLYTDRDGSFYRLSNGVQTKIEGVPSVLAKGQGGLMDVELHPKFAENSLIYLSYSKPKDNTDKSPATTAVMRAKLDGNKLVDGKDIFVAEPYQNTRHHYGSRIEFDKQGYMFVTVGDRGQHDAKLPQKLDNDMGKVHRLMDDGRVPTDNPFVNTPNAHGSIWSYGHRNPQGMAMNPNTGVIWAHEHGPRGGDELNIPTKGKNYGWPVISFGINYDGTILTPNNKLDGMEQPVTYWVPSLGPSGMTYVTGDRYKAWKGDILMGSMRFKYLNRVHMNGNKVESQEMLLKNIGRVRAVEMGRDGFIYVAVEEPGYIFRLVPMDKM